jgi:RNA polymerase sigma-70 factor (ECF subfamily)
LTRGNHRQEPPIELSPDSPATGGAPSPAGVSLLIEASVSGDVAAFGDLYRLYASSIYRYFFYRVRQDSEAQDLTAQVFLNAWKAIRRYQPADIPFLVWLYAIARNLLLNHNRKNRVRGAYEDSGEALVDRAADLSGESDPLRSALRQSENEGLVRAFEQLNGEQQQVIYYRFVENWSHAEVARTMRKSEGAVRALQFRALESLRRILGAGSEEFDFDKTSR